jgi:hypothetical protein
MRHILVSLALLFLARLSFMVDGSIAHAQVPIGSESTATTAVCGSLAASETWTAANSLYDVCGQGVNVPAGMTLTIDPILVGTPLPQGSKPRVAVEGYAGSQLLGGVTIDVIVPDYRPFDGHTRSNFPLVRR